MYLKLSMLRNKYDKTDRYFEEFKVGQIYKHNARKTITGAEHRQFCELTLNYHPLHWDETYAKLSNFGRIVVVGTYVASIAVGISVPDISVNAIANLDYEKIDHLVPVFEGDTLQAETEILEIRESRSKPDRGIIFVETRLYNQHNDKVLSLRRHVLIPKKV
ncbi:MaoC family dehydratase [Candidatus Cloacimonadota bacterium]